MPYFRYSFSFISCSLGDPVRNHFIPTGRRVYPRLAFLSSGFDTVQRVVPSAWSNVVDSAAGSQPEHVDQLIGKVAQNLPMWCVTNIVEHI
jgi:hypothetical protein